MISIAHIINPVKVNENSDFHTSQLITFQSIIRAKSFCKSSEQIALFTAQFPEDHEVIPKEFHKLSDLKLSAQALFSSEKVKKLPYISEILSLAAKEVNAEYIIFTNMDIALMPNFYDYVLHQIASGYDAIVINRRRISQRYNDPAALPLMYAELGKSHPGFDCFVFHKSLINKMILGEILVGVPFLETSLIHNIFSLADQPLFVPDAHLTFHIGEDVLNFSKDQLYWHNRKVFFKRIQPALKPRFALKKFPYGTLPWPRRMIAWMLNPSLFSRNYFHLEGRGVLRKLKSIGDAIRWRILQR